MRATYQVVSITTYVNQMQVNLSGVQTSNPANNQFTKGAPAGGCTFLITDPAAFQAVKVGATYFFDITEATGTI